MGCQQFKWGIAVNASFRSFHRQGIDVNGTPVNCSYVHIFLILLIPITRYGPEKIFASFTCHNLLLIYKYKNEQ